MSTSERLSLVAQLEANRQAADVECLLVMLHDDQTAEVRYSAASALGRIGNRAAMLGLIVSLERDSSESVKTNAVQALGMLEAADARPVLVRALQHGSLHVRRAAAEALSHYDTPTSRAALEAALDDPAKLVRGWSAESLATVGDRQSLISLREAIARESRLSYARVMMRGAAVKLTTRLDSQP